MKDSLILIVTTLGFSASIYFGAPSLLPSKKKSLSIEEVATPVQLTIIEQGEVSGRLLSESSPHDVVTQSTISKFDGSSPSRTAIFPPELTFEETPPVNPKEKERIALRQRISLLENQLRAIEIRSNLSPHMETWSWSWGLEKLWIVVIWVTGTILGTVLKFKTEECLKRS